MNPQSSAPVAASVPHAAEPGVFNLQLKALSLLFVFLVLPTFLAVTWFNHMKRVHQHCIKATGIAFRQYAEEHNGKLPYHTNGFGDALLLLVSDQYLSEVRYLCGPNDQGEELQTALHSGTDVPESACSRVYVQGLDQTNDSAICILFDRRSVRGGDHRNGFGPKLREVCLLDGSMQTIPDDRWPEFVRKQIELLVVAGIDAKTAHALYAESGTNK